MTYKTFSDLGISFEETSPSCYTCTGGSCHNIVTHKENGAEYSVLISTIDRKTFHIQATVSSNTSSASDIEETDLTERDAVKYLCDNFPAFKCF